jgi:hypothetical protein
LEDEEGKHKEEEGIWGEILRSLEKVLLVVELSNFLNE